MGIDYLTLSAAKGYTDESLLGLGALKGAPCTIKSITEVDGGQKVTFEWTGTSGTKQTSEMTIKNGVSITDIDVNANNQIVFTMSDGSEIISGKIPTVKGDKGDPFKYSDFTSEQLASLKGSDGFSPSAKIEKVGDTATITITDKDGTTTATIKDGQGGTGGSGEENKIDSISVNGVNVAIDENKNVDITVPSIDGLTKDADLATVAKSGSYDDLSNKPTIPSLDGYAKTSEIPSKVSDLENDSNYLSSIPEEYVTETELSAKGYLTEHQDISGKVDKVEGKSLIADTEIARLASVDNYDDTAIKAEIAKKADTTSIPSKVSELTNDSNYQTAEQVNSTVTTEIAKVVADAPESLNTLKEMSDWIAGHEDDASAMNSAISDNKTAITALQTGKADKSEIPTTVAQLTDSSSYAKKTDLHSHDNKTVLDGITSTKVSNWDTAKTHADSAHAPSTAQENVLETVKVNGTALEVSNKAVNVTVPTKVSELADSADYAKTADIPTTLPANGGNSDTVNNHTVETDVPTDAKFTDTVYDDTEVKESIAEVNSNLDTLEFGEVAGGKNLLQPILEITTQNGVTCTANGDGTYTFNGTATTNTWFTLGKAKLYSGKTCRLCGLNKVGNSTLYIQLRNDNIVMQTTNDGINVNITETSENYLVVAFLPEGVTYNNIIYKPMITEDLSATYDDYKPYIPSVKMLSEENEQQNIEAIDLKMLGWTVPKKCPIQNYTDSDGVFHQRVGRVDLGSLDWSYVTNPNRFNADFNSVKFTSTSTPIVAYSTKYDVYSFNTAINKDKAISVWGSNDIASFLVVIDSSYTDADTFKNAMKGVYLYYELATPITKTIDGNEAVAQIKNDLNTLEFGEVAAGKNLFKGDFIKKVLDPDINYTDIDLSKEQNPIKNIEGITFVVFGAYLKKGTYTFSYINNGYFSLNRIAIAGTNCINVVETIRKSYTWTQNTDGWTYFGIEGDDSETGVTDTPFSITPNIQIEKGTQATQYEPYIPSVKMLEDEVSEQNDSLSVIGKCKNLLNPTLQTTTKDGVTCTNNGDGTYTVSGTATKNFTFSFINRADTLDMCQQFKGKFFKFISNINDIEQLGHSYMCIGQSLSEDWNKWGSQINNGKIAKIDTQIYGIVCDLHIFSGDTFDNVLIKPMLTTDLSATYDDFVPYTGDGDTLTHDVAELKNDLDKIKSSAIGDDWGKSWTYKVSSTTPKMFALHWANSTVIFCVFYNKVIPFNQPFTGETYTATVSENILTVTTSATGILRTI